MRSAWKSKLPSTTQVISPNVDFSMIPPHVLELASARGTMVHDICERHAQGEWIIPSMIREEGRGYFKSFKKWFALVETVHVVEAELIDPVYGFCGHPDLIVTMRGRSRPQVVDLKTPVSKSPAWRLQIASYNRLAEVQGYNVAGSGTLRLSPKGNTPGYDEYTDTAEDFNVFLSCLLTWNYFHRS